MRKLLRGILEFRRTRREAQRATFPQLVLGQKPDALLIGCSDSRVAVNWFASVDPGDLFVVRNVGNLVPPYEYTDAGSPAAAVEFALESLKVRDIIVCGHSDCGAMQALSAGRDKVSTPRLRDWLTHGSTGAATLPLEDDPALAPHNQLSQRNVLLQLAHLTAYPSVEQALAAGTVRLHAWWFDIGELEVSVYDEGRTRFVPIDEEVGPRLLATLEE